MQDIVTIGPDSCKRYTWDDVSQDAKDMNMNRSQFIWFLYWDFKKRKKINIRYTDIAILLLMCVTTLCVLLLVVR